MTRVTKPVRAAVPAVTFTLAFAACGDDGSRPDTTTSVGSTVGTSITATATDTAGTASATVGSATSVG